MEKYFLYKIFLDVYGTKAHQLLEFEKLKDAGAIPQSHTNGVPDYLDKEIMEWLKNHKDLPLDELKRKVKFTLLERATLFEVLDYASLLYILQLNFSENIMPEYLVKASLGSLEIAVVAAKKSKSKQTKDAKKVKDDNFKLIWNELKTYWKNNLTHIKKATQIAIALEKTDIYKNLDIKPARGTIERYVRDWQKNWQIMPE